MSKKFNIVILITTLFIITFSSCNKESTLPIQNDNQNSTNELKTLVNQVKVWHDSVVSNKVKSLIAENNIKPFSLGPDDITPPSIDWDKAFINFDSNNIKSVTIPLSMNYSNGENLQLVATKYKKSTNGYLIKILPDSIYFSKQVDIYDYKNFNGSITIYNLNGIRLKKEIFKQGIVSKSAFNSKPSQSNQTTFDTEPPCDGCDLLTVVMHNSKRFSYSFGSYDYGLIYISNYQNIQLNEFNGGGVFAGGGDESADGINYYYQFPLKSDYIKKYPKFTELVKNIYENSYKVPKLLNWLKGYSNLSDQALFNTLQFNQGPTIVITDLNGPDWGGTSRYGHFDRDKKIIEIDKNLVTNYENGIFKNGDAYTIFLAATLLHETVHYGRYITKIYEYDGEYGSAFQLAADYGNFDLLDK
jgi:hypothetical protein